MKIGQKLFLGFGVAVLALVVAGVVAITQIDNVGAKTDQLYDNNLTQLDHAASLRRDMLLERTAILGYVLSPAEKRATYGDKIKAFQGNIDDDLKTLRSGHVDAEEAGLLDEVEQSVNAWWPARDKGPIGRTDAGDHDGAVQAALFGIGGQHFQAAFDAAVKFTGAESANAQDAHTSAQSTKSTATLVMIVLIAVAAIASAAIAFWIAWSITSRIKRLTAVSDRLSRGDIEGLQVDVAGGDEVGQLGDSLQGVLAAFHELSIEVQRGSSAA